MGVNDTTYLIALLLFMIDNILHTHTSKGDLTSLKKLYLSENVLQSLPTQMGRLSNLTHLFLQSNLIQMLPASLSTLSQLFSVNISNNPFVGDMSSLEKDYGT